MTDIVAVVPQDMGITPVVNVATALRRIRELQEFVKAVMVQGEDYGVIPGTKKPTLFKSGAEKLCEMYGLAPTCEITNRIEQWEVPFFQYELKVRLISKATGVIVAEGIGSCNSRENRYRNQDAYTIVNTLQKMAKKRALVDAALSATRSSGLFTQDLEDLQDAPEPAAPKTAKPLAATPVPTPAAPPKFDPRARTEKRYLALTEKADALGVAAPTLQSYWSDEELAQHGRELAAAIATAETEMERHPLDGDD